MKKLNVIFGVVTMLILCATLTSCSNNYKDHSDTIYNDYSEEIVSKVTTEEETSEEETCGDVEKTAWSEETNEATVKFITVPIKLFSEYSGINPFYSDVVAGAYGEQFSINMKTAKKYEKYLIEQGYVFDEYDTEEDTDKYIGMTIDDWIYVIDHGDSVSFLYGGDVRLEIGNASVAELFLSEQFGGYSYPDPVYPDINRKTLCPVCSGTGKVICKGCNGLGYIPSIKYSPDYGYGSSVYEVKNHCYSCSGIGQSMCTRCFGTGYVQ